MTQASMESFDSIVSVERLFLSWDLFRRGKRNRADVQFFERRLEENIFQLHRDLTSDNYAHETYHSFFICDPKQRHIHKASVRDRIVHQAVYLALDNMYERGFYFHSYSSRVGKGTHRAIEAAKSAFLKCSRNNTRPCWALKCDIRRFYDSVKHEILYEILSQKVKDERLLLLIKKIVGSFEVVPGSAQGLPIGNLTSQIFTNIVLNTLDVHVKQGLGFRYYFRYCDDCLLISHNTSSLQAAFALMRQFLQTQLQLEFHPHKCTLRPYHHGVDFLGFVLLPFHRVIRTKSKQRMKKRVSDLRQSRRHERREPLKAV